MATRPVDPFCTAGLPIVDHGGNPRAKPPHWGTEDVRTPQT